MSIFKTSNDIKTQKLPTDLKTGKTNDTHMDII